MSKRDEFMVGFHFNPHRHVSHTPRWERVLLHFRPEAAAGGLVSNKVFRYCGWL